MVKAKKDLSIVFMGTPKFATTILERIIQEEYNIKAVITAPDRPAGRGQKLSESDVKKCAKQNNIEVLQPTNLKDEQFIEKLQSYQADLFVVVAFRMLPEAVWRMPALGTFNLHGSLLPQYRGAAPINWAVINGETKTGVTTFFIDEKIDTGEIILNREMEIGENETAGEVHDRMMLLGADVVIETIELIRKGIAQAQPQPKGTHKPAPKIFKQDCLVDFTLSIEDIHNFIRGLSPYPTAWIKLKMKENDQTKTMKIFKTSILNKEKNDKIFLENRNGEFLLNLLDGTISLHNVQLEGKKRLKSQDFLLGFSPNEWSIIID